MTVAIQRTYTGPKPSIRLPEGAIDTQTHIFLEGYPAREGGPPLPEGLPGIAEYRQVMDWLGIDRVVVTIGNAHQFDNACLVECLKRMGDIARGIAAISGDTTDSEMTALADAGVRGVRIMNLPGGAIGLDGLETVSRKAKDHDWVTAVQFDGSHILDHVDRLAAIPGNWILDHHGKFFSGVTHDGPEIDAVKSLIDGGNCWFKLAGCYESTLTGPPDYDDIAAVTRVLVDHAPERIVWGTNWPHNLAQRTEDYPDDRALLDTVVGWIPEQHRLQVLVDTPATLFGFT